MKIVTASDIGIVSQTPDTPISFGRTSINITTRNNERSNEITAEINPFPSAVKYPERNTFRPNKHKNRTEQLQPSQSVEHISIPTNNVNDIFP